MNERSGAYRRRYMAKCRSEGRCVDCGKPVMSGRVRCTEHLEKQNAHSKQWYIDCSQGRKGRLNQIKQIWRHRRWWKANQARLDHMQFSLPDDEMEDYFQGEVDVFSSEVDSDDWRPGVVERGAVRYREIFFS
jgi:hypothetical protein